MEDTQKVICPICKGTGELKAPKRKLGLTELKYKAVKILRENHFSYREIMLLCDYKSPRSIQKILKD